MPGRLDEGFTDLTYLRAIIPNGISPVPSIPPALSSPPVPVSPVDIQPAHSFVGELQGLSASEIREVIASICLEPPADSADNRKVALDLVQAIRQRSTLSAVGPDPPPGNQTHPYPRPANNHFNRVALSPTGIGVSFNDTGDNRRGQGNQSTRHPRRSPASNMAEGYARCTKCKCVFSHEDNGHISCNFHPGRVHFLNAKIMNMVPYLGNPHFNYTPSAYRWTCCGTIVGEISGCRSQRHEGRDRH